MNEDVKIALAGIKSAWKNMLMARDKATYNFWSEEQLKLQKILYDERHRVLLRLRSNPDGRPKKKEKRGRPKKYKSEVEKQLQLQRYQHEYYLKVTKIKRAERRKNEAQK